MNFFQIQNKLFFSKKDTAGYLDVEGQEAFIPFLINRWMSFYNKDTPNFVNETLNKYSIIFDDKQRVYRMYYNLIPRLKFKRIKYIKKIKKNHDVDQEYETKLHLVAKSNSMSVREVKQYMDLFPS